MAPKKRSVKQEDEPAAKPAPASSRVTRSSARLAVNSKANLTTKEAAPEFPKRKKAKRSQKENGKEEEVKPEEVETEEEEEEKEKEVDASEKLSDDSKNKTVVIEHCKQCQSFKKRAIQVQIGLENEVPGITVLLNPDKPRRGCFEIRSEDGQKFISLLDMKRPFTRMKELDMEKVISDIIEQVKG